LIEQDAQLRRGQGAAGRVLQDGTDLIRRYARKPFHELRDESTVFQVFEQGCHRDTGAAEHPGSTHTFRAPLNGWTRGPIDHDEVVSPQPRGG